MRNLIIKADVFERQIGVMVSPKYLEQTTEQEILDRLLAVDHVKYAYPLLVDEISAEVRGEGLPSLDGVISSGSPEHIPPVKTGTSLNAVNSILVPHKVYIRRGQQIDIIYAEGWIGQTLTFTVREHPGTARNLDYNVVGVYHNNSNEPKNTFYISMDSFAADFIDAQAAPRDVYGVLADRAKNVDTHIADLSGLSGFTAAKIAKAEPEADVDISLLMKLSYVITAVGVVTFFSSSVATIIGKPFGSAMLLRNQDIRN